MRDELEAHRSGSRRWYVIAGVVATLVVVAGVAAWWFVFRDDAPPAVDLGAAVAQLDEDLAGTDPDSEPPDGDPAEAADAGPADAPQVEEAISGEWTVDNTIGTFDYETASGSFAGFRVDEELTLGETTAVGRTGDVAGTIVIEGSSLVAADVEIDLTTITTDRSQRDSRVQSALETSIFATASFSLTSPVEIPEGAARGESFTVEAAGDLTLHGVTNPTTFTIEAQLVDDIAVVVGSTEIVFDDYGVAAPSAPIVLSVEDHGIIEFQLLFTR